MSRDEKEDNTIYKVVVNHEDNIPFGRPTGRMPWAGMTSAR